MTNKVEAYRCANDGTLHESREACARHEIKIAILDVCGEVGAGLSDARSEDAQAALHLVAGSVASHPRITTLFAAAIRAAEEDIEEANLRSAGVLSEVAANQAVELYQHCAECQWQDHCTSKQECHLDASGQRGPSGG